MSIKKYMRIVRIGTLAGLGMLLVHSCTKKDWDEHYAEPEYLNTGGILNVLSANAEYSEFTGLLRKTGFDSLLRRSSLYTVLAVKNGAFSTIDTNANTPSLRKVIGMHIFPSAVYRQDMDNKALLSVSGKRVYFAHSGNEYSANGLRFNADGIRTLNGQIYGVAQAILPRPNLAEAIGAGPAFSMFSGFLQASFISVPDPLRNTVIGTDATMKPIYQAPVIYKQVSAYLEKTKIDDEKVLSTVFMPSDVLVNYELSKLLTAREGRPELIIPKISGLHGDTTIGYYFIPRDAPYPGDSAILKNYLFNHVVVRGNITSLADGMNTFTNVNGDQLLIGSDQVQGGVYAASNGSFYNLASVSLPDMIYRSKFMFQPTLRNPAPATSYALNPGVSFSGGAVYVSDIGGANYLNTYRGRASRFNFTNIGAVINFTMPYATKGRYRVLLKNFLDNNGCIVNASYGDQLLKQNINASTQYALAEISSDVDLGIIDVQTSGPVRITFKCANVSPKSPGQYLFSVDMLILEPVTAP